MKTSIFAQSKNMTPEQRALLKMAGSRKRSEAVAAQEMLAKALELPLREGILSGDILGNIFEAMDFSNQYNIEFQLDFMNPGTERDFYAYLMPNRGAPGRRSVEGDYVTVPTYDITNAIDTHLKYIRDARWDVVSRMGQVLEAGFVKKMNDDGWHLLLSAGVDRNVLVFDADASAGQFTKRLVSLMKTIVARNGGGNGVDGTGFRLTDLYLSLEAMEDIRNWNIDQLDEISRNMIFNAQDGMISRIYSVNLHPLYELGVGQEYQIYYTSNLSGTMGSADEEVVVGLDLSKNSFVMPVRQEVEVFVDENMHRERLFGLYGFAEQGFASLDNRSIVIGSF